MKAVAMMVGSDVPTFSGRREAVRTTCPYCGVGCGVLITREPDGAHSVQGDPEHPANFGRLCSKGAALAETLDVSDRLLAPRVAGRETDWDSALNLVATRLRQTIDEHGPDSVAFYVSGQLLTEDYYVANKFVKGWLGNANIDTNSRLCMASSVAGHRRAFGTDTVPGTYEDLELADLVVLVGSNLAWCHPVLFQRLQAAREARPCMRIVLIDPRRTATTELADLHLSLAPDSDIALFGGLLCALDDNGAIDTAFADAHVDGFETALASVRGLDVDTVAALTALTPVELESFYALFSATDRVVSVYSQGVNQSARGTDTVHAIIDCHLATGRIGRPGMGPFSITGQPNAMGGREVGGLSNMLAAHVELGNARARARVQKFWDSPCIAEKPGPMAVELFERVRDGKIKAVWIMATNPVDSLPDADRVRDALARCPFVVVSDVVEGSDTGAVADVLLPSAAWSEKDGTVTNSERRISRQRCFRTALDLAKPDWWQIAEVAKRLECVDVNGRPAFDWVGPAEIFREHAALSAAAGSPDFDIGAAASLDDAGYDALAPFQWPWREGSAPGERRFFADGVFHTPSGRGRMWPIEVQPFIATPAGCTEDRSPGRKPTRTPTRTVILNTGRIRDQWHTMTRTGRVARLSSHLAEPFAEIAPVDADALGINGADIVELASASGKVRMRALVTDRQRPGSVFVPMHWSDAWASRARVDALVSRTVDPVSGQPASKSEPVKLARWGAASYAFAVSAHRPDGLRTALGNDYWALSPTATGWRIEIASTDSPALLLERLDALLVGAAYVDRAIERVSHDDSSAGLGRRLLLEGTRLATAWFVGPAPVGLARRWLAEQIGQQVTGTNARHRLLAGRPEDDLPDPGATVCACFDVGATTIKMAITADGNCTTVAKVGARTRAGTNCGSCRPEIRRMLEAESSLDHSLFVKRPVLFNSPVVEV